MQGMKLNRVRYVTALGILICEAKVTKEELKELDRVANKFNWYKYTTKVLRFEKV